MTKKFKKCYLHIGSEKTGTTSLQEFLKTNREKLLELGFFIPQAMGRSEHVDLVCLFANSTKRFSRRTRLGLRTEASVEQHKSVLYTKIEAELRKNADSSRSLVISTERLFTMISEKEEINALKEFLLKLCDTVEIIAYIRPQHEFALSIYSTALKGGSIQSSCYPKIDDKSQRSRAYYYDQVLNFWKKHFHESVITVRKFQRKELIDGDTIQDFAKILDIDTATLTPPRNHNISLSAKAQTFLKYFNQYIPKYNSPKTSQIRGNINKILENNFPGSSKLPSRAEARAFYDQFSQSNENTRTNWFPLHSTLFDVSFEKYPESAEEENLSLDECFQIFAKIYQVNTVKINKLQNKIEGDKK